MILLAVVKNSWLNQHILTRVILVKMLKTYWAQLAHCLAGSSLGFVCLQVSGTIRNCCFEAENQLQNLLLISEFLWPALLLPVAGNKVMFLWLSRSFRHFSFPFLFSLFLWGGGRKGHQDFFCLISYLTTVNN